MEVVLDGERLEGEPQGANLQEILRDLMDNRVEGQRALREVKINGQVYQLDQMGPPETVPREQVKSLEVQTADAAQMALEFFAYAPEVLQAINRAVGAVAELFRVADEREANEHYVNIVESLHYFMSMLDESRRALSLDFATVESEGRNAAQSLERLAGLVKDLLAAQEKADWVLLADLLEYELVPELDNWQTFTRLLHEKGRS